jgi:3-phosphoshikimate 1-carboxyvinyltransferase
MRFLAALATLCREPAQFMGEGRLPTRPMDELLTVLEDLGAAVTRGEAGLQIPLAIGSGPDPARGGVVRIGSGRSSQFASALLLIGSRLEGGLDLSLTADAVSIPYVGLTAAILSGFGAGVEQAGPRRWKVQQAGYAGRIWKVEGDWSSASYLMAAAAVAGGSVRVRGLDAGSHQPDAALLPVLVRCGQSVTVDRDEVKVTGDGSPAGFEMDVSSCPDLAPTLAILGLFSRERCELRSAGILRYKESDRLELLAENLARLGRPAEVRGDSLILPECPGVRLRGGEIRTGADHRIAMAFAVAGLALPGVVIQEPQCVGKSNPGFWDQIERLEDGS